jgi:hypothetical protein
MLLSNGEYSINGKVISSIDAGQEMLVSNGLYSINGYVISSIGDGEVDMNHEAFEATSIYSYHESSPCS